MDIKEILKKYPDIGIYDGINVDGQEVIVIRYEDGCSVKTLQENEWWQVLDFDEKGILIAESYEKKGENN